MADQEKPGRADEVRRTPQGELARKLHLLLDIADAEGDKPATFPDISAAMTVRGVKLSRARWSYMKDGNGRLISDRPLLTALADYFKVSPDYLITVEDIEISEEAWDQLESVHSFREAKVKSFVDQTLGDVSPETLEDIVEYLSDDLPLPPGVGAVGDDVDSPDEPPVVP
ncbi:hypothetical protein AS189_09665 [Arthrobacter alpinus]|uniref:Uncharacterized protein n=1 Tax=Arthrobacter alpinus TaxID=656366 RepID=A0A0S2LZA2_9MICC|nr:hypothetical protein AS189_09665 [Arthrobacter alpinus]